MPDSHPNPVPPGQTHFEIHVDGKPFRVTTSSMTGAQIKALVHKDAQYQLFQELQGKESDKLIGDGDNVHITNGLHFYTVAPATFGM